MADALEQLKSRLTDIQSLDALSWLLDWDQRTTMPPGGGAHRADHLALLQRLAPYRPYLIQFGPERWLVCAETPGYHDEPLPKALATIDDCLQERRVEDAVVRIDGRSVRPEKRHALNASSALR